MNTTTEVPFTTIKHDVRDRFAEMTSIATKQRLPLLRLDYDRDEIWSAYLNAFPEETRQEHNCNCCKAFIRQVGGAVVVHPNGARSTLWASDSASPGVRGVADYLAGRPIAGLFYHEGSAAGTDKNLDKVRNVIWQHFHLDIPRSYVNDERKDNRLGRLSAAAKETRNVFVRGAVEITDDAIDSVLELVAQNSLYRGNEQKGAIEAFQKAKKEYLAAGPDTRDAMGWRISAALPEAVARLRNTAIGTLLVDLSGGRDLEESVKAFERIVAPANYRRPTALVTPRMVETAKARLESLGLISALKRRRLDDRDLTAEHALYVYRPTTKEVDVFASITADAPVDVKTFSKVEEIGIDAFLKNVVPTSKDLRVLVESGHLGNFVTLTGPQDEEVNNLMKWGNSFGWSYTGGMADSIKEKVKAAGGDVNGWLRASLAWHNHDDLDLHFASTREHVFFRNKRGQEAWLDVDMNAGYGTTREPVENITVPRALKPGKYEIRVNQYYVRETTGVGYELEIEVNGQTYSFGSAKNPRQSATEVFRFTVLPDGQVVFDDGSASHRRSVTGVVKWGIKTGVFHRVNAVTLSPNHWDRPIGNKHFMFLLHGCTSDEPTRPFLNEQLIDDLAQDRKTMEALGGKIEVAPAQGMELSGLGFSDTQRNHLYVEVTGAVTRVVKVLF